MYTVFAHHLNTYVQQYNIICTHETILGSTEVGHLCWILSLFFFGSWTQKLIQIGFHKVDLNDSGLREHFSQKKNKRRRMEQFWYTEIDLHPMTFWSQATQYPWWVFALPPFPQWLSPSISRWCLRGSDMSKAVVIGCGYFIAEPVPKSLFFDDRSQMRLLKFNFACFLKLNHKRIRRDI